MIKINLLPTDGGRRPASPGAKKFKAPQAGVWPYAAGLIAAYALAGFFAWGSYSAGVDSTKLLSAASDKRDKKKKEVKRRQAEFETNLAAAREIEEKWEVVQALSPQDRIFWSEKLNMIAKARLNLAVYITKLTLDEKIDELETPESVKRREDWAKKHGPNEPEPKPIKRPVINQTLTLDAIAYGTDSPQRLRQIRAFSSALQNMVWTRESGVQTRFLDKLIPDFAQLPHRVDRVGGVDVIRFGFVIKAETQTDRTSEIADKKQAAKAAGKAGGSSK